MCACVNRTAFTEDALNGGSCQLRSRNSCPPWNKPQSISRRPRSDSIRYFDPVTVPAAPQKERLGMRGIVTDRVRGVKPKNLLLLSPFRRSVGMRGEASAQGAPASLHHFISREEMK